MRRVLWQMAANEEQMEQLRHENKMLKEELNKEIEAAKCGLNTWISCVLAAYNDPDANADSIILHAR